MFRSAVSKLEDARANLESLAAATDAIKFRSAFTSFLSNCRAVTYALQKEGAHVDGFGDWYEPKRYEMKGDELLRFIHESRKEDFHEGAHPLCFCSEISYVNTGGPEDRPHPDAAMIAGAQGAFWVVDAGTPKERRIPVKKQGSYKVVVSIENPPATHRGQPLSTQNPISLCRVALDYMAELVHEAKTIFEGTA